MSNKISKKGLISGLVELPTELPGESDIKDLDASQAVLSLSGGLDSTCLLLWLLAHNQKSIRAYSFDYGQRHQVELKKVKKNIKFLQKKGFDITHQILNLRDVFSDSASSLRPTDPESPEIPEGNYNDSNMKSTVVENRNIIFSSIVYSKALGWANKSGQKTLISLGTHSGDHCLTGDTPVRLWDNSIKQIKDIKIGDTVRSYDIEKGIFVPGTVSASQKTGESTVILNIYTSSDKEIHCTPDHKILTVAYKNGNKELVYKTARELSKNDVLLLSDPEHQNAIGSPTMGQALQTIITDITEMSGNDFIPVYDLTVETYNNFLADDLIVHNCIYPDCRPESVNMAKELYAISNWNSENVDYISPFENIDKSQVLAEGIKSALEIGLTPKETLKVLSNTHTCYNPDPESNACGKCGSCTERLEAFEKNHLTDPAHYHQAEA